METKRETKAFPVGNVARLLGKGRMQGNGQEIAIGNDDDGIDGQGFQAGNRRTHHADIHQSAEVKNDRLPRDSRDTRDKRGLLWRQLHRRWWLGIRNQIAIRGHHSESSSRVQLSPNANWRVSHSRFHRVVV